MLEITYGVSRKGSAITSLLAEEETEVQKC